MNVSYAVNHLIKFNVDHILGFIIQMRGKKKKIQNNLFLGIRYIYFFGSTVGAVNVNAKVCSIEGYVLHGYTGKRRRMEHTIHKYRSPDTRQNRVFYGVNYTKLNIIIYHYLIINNIDINVWLCNNKE